MQPFFYIFFSDRFLAVRSKHINHFTSLISRQNFIHVKDVVPTTSSCASPITIFLTLFFFCTHTNRPSPRSPRTRVLDAIFSIHCPRFFSFFSHFSAPYLGKIFSSPHTLHCWWVCSQLFSSFSCCGSKSTRAHFDSVFRSCEDLTRALTKKSDFSVGGNQERWWRSVELYFILCVDGNLFLGFANQPEHAYTTAVKGWGSSPGSRLATRHGMLLELFFFLDFKLFSALNEISVFLLPSKEIFSRSHTLSFFCWPFIVFFFSSPKIFSHSCRAKMCCPVICPIATTADWCRPSFRDKNDLKMWLIGVQND